jgi:hypothetical protein
MPTRNSPCPCNSGKKFKHCCAGKKPAAGPCAILLPPDFLTPCNRPGSGGLKCTYCDQGLFHCAIHHGQALQQMRGHALRAHPEKVPGMLARTKRDPKAIAAIREQYAKDPANWQKVVEQLWPE